MFVLIYLHLSERSRSAFICHKFEEKCCWNPSSLRGVNIISWITCGSVTMFTISCLFISCGSVTILPYFLRLWNHASQQLLELSKPDFLPSLCNRALFVLISRAKCLPTPQKWVFLPYRAACKLSWPRKVHLNIELAFSCDSQSWAFPPTVVRGLQIKDTRQL